MSSLRDRVQINFEIGDVRDQRRFCDRFNQVRDNFPDFSANNLWIQIQSNGSDWWGNGDWDWSPNWSDNLLVVNNSDQDMRIQANSSCGNYRIVPSGGQARINHQGTSRFQLRNGRHLTLGPNVGSNISRVIFTNNGLSIV